MTVIISEKTLLITSLFVSSLNAAAAVSAQTHPVSDAKNWYLELRANPGL